MSESACRGKLEGVLHQSTLALFHRGGRPPRAAAAESLRTNLLRFAAFELAVWASLYAAYLAVRGATIGSPEDALKKGREIVAAENALRIFHEARIQDALSALERFFSAYYMVAFGPFVATTLVWLALRDRPTTASCDALLVAIAAQRRLRALPRGPAPPHPRLGSPTPSDSPATTRARSPASASTRTPPCRPCTSAGACSSASPSTASPGVGPPDPRPGSPRGHGRRGHGTGNHFVLDAVAGAAIAGAVVALMRLAPVRRTAVSAQTPRPN